MCKEYRNRRSKTYIVEINKGDKWREINRWEKKELALMSQEIIDHAIAMDSLKYSTRIIMEEIKDVQRM